MTKLKIIFEDDDYLIINKPAGLLVHGAKHITEPSLVDFLLEKYPNLIKVGEDPLRPGIVHRLDKSASGLLAVAKNQKAFNSLKSQFQARTVKKYYKALVYGQIEKDEDIINFPILRSSQGNKMAALPLTIKGEKNTIGRTAITEFEVTRRFINYTLIGVKIKTGRTHQIRVHMSALGHPIVGDDLYGTKKTKEKNAKFRKKKMPGSDRFFLVACELEFEDLNGKKKNFKIDIPKELKELLKIIK